jgi:hypothetical protein
MDEDRSDLSHPLVCSCLRPVVFHAIYMYVAPDKFTFAVIDTFMLVAFSDKAVVGNQFVRVDGRALCYVGFDDWLQRLFADIGNDLSHNFVVALNHTEDDGLGFGATAALDGPVSADLGFVDFD